MANENGDFLVQAATYLGAAAVAVLALEAEGQGHETVVQPRLPQVATKIRQCSKDAVLRTK